MHSHHEHIDSEKIDGVEEIVGNVDAVFNNADISEAIAKGRERYQQPPDKLLVNGTAYQELLTNESFIQEHDLLINKDNADNNNVILKLWWYHEKMGSPDGIIFSIPVFHDDIDCCDCCPNGLLVFDDGIVGIEG